MSDVAPQHIEPFIESLKPGFSTAWENAVKALNDAYNAGFKAGYEKSALELKHKIAGVLSQPVPNAVSAPESKPLSGHSPLTSPSSPISTERRAPRGSIRPTVINALREYGVPGLRVSEVAIRTGTNENSVRGMLNALAHEGVTEKHGELWVLKNTEAAADLLGLTAASE